MSQIPLFPEDVGAGVEKKRFVFDIDPEELFESQTSIIPETFIDAALWRIGFSGVSETEREQVVAAFAARMVAQFADDVEFAARIANSEDPRPELNELVKNWLNERAASATR